MKPISKASKDKIDIHRSLGQYLETDEDDKDSVSNSSIDESSDEDAVLD